MTDVNWDDLKLFHIVATEGGLAGAASLTGISAPTIGRKMLFLERTMDARSLSAASRATSWRPTA